MWDGNAHVVSPTVGSGLRQMVCHHGHGNGGNGRGHGNGDNGHGHGNGTIKLMSTR